MLVAADANAQQRGNLALDRFNPAPSGDDFFEVQSYRTGTGNVDFSGMILADYARNPLTAYELSNGKQGKEIATLVSDQLVLHAAVSLSLYERFQLSIDFPMVLLDRGDSVVTPGLTIAAPSGAAVGDLRGGARFRLFGDRDAPIGLALAGYVFIPTGDDTKFAGTDSVRGNPSLALGGRVGPLLWGLNGGVMIQKAAVFADTRVGTDLTFGAGAAFLMAHDNFQVGPELYGTTLLDRGPDAGALPVFDTKSTSLEAILGMKGRIDPIVLGAGMGPGFTKGPGTPRLRAILSIAYAPVVSDRDHDGVLDKDDACPDVFGVRTSDPATNGCPVGDRDHDGILDDVDACPDIPGPASPDPKKNGCPLITERVGDRDHDGIPDDKDACPDVPGVPNDDPAKNGCPPDRDGDGIPDDVDACPDVKGVANADPKKNGCPLDTDGDGIPDTEDACPTEPGKPNADPKKNGCPMVFISGGSIVITEQVEFKTGSDFILPASDELLTNVNKVFVAHPEITKVLIEGHTDSVGGKAYNQGLSERRAASVRKWLVRHGVDDKRLQSKGFGLERPIGDNATPEGRQLNRRVEFKILEGAKQPGISVQGTGAVPPPAPH